MKIFNVIVIACVCFTSPAGNTAEFIGDAGLHFGGDTLTTVYDKNGNAREVKAGQLLSVAVGVRLDVTESFELPITFGVKTDVAWFDNGNDRDAKDGEVRFNRFPINALLLYKTAGWRFGIGPTYHIKPQLSYSSNGYKQSYGFENAWGYIVDIRYLITDKIYMGTRYTNIEYKLKDYPSAKKYDGSSIGVIIGAHL